MHGAGKINIHLPYLELTTTNTLTQKKKMNKIIIKKLK